MCLLYGGIPKDIMGAKKRYGGGGDMVIQYRVGTRLAGAFDIARANCCPASSTVGHLQVAMTETIMGSGSSRFMRLRIPAPYQKATLTINQYLSWAA